MTDRKLDQTISDWLEAEAPGQMPDRVLRATFERTRETRQQVGWRAVLRRPQMNRLIALCGTAVVVAVAAMALGIYVNRAGLDVGGQPTPSVSPSPPPSPGAGFSRFSSTIHGISIDYPSNWQVRPATESWNHDAFAFDAPGVDVIFDPALQDDLYLSLASEPLGGQSAEAWWTSALAWAADEVCETGGTYGGLSGDGWRGATRGCDADEDQVIAVATATHGYLIYLHVGDDPVLRARYDWNNFFGPLTLETVELR